MGMAAPQATVGSWGPRLDVTNDKYLFYAPLDNRYAIQL